jgi:hypothetical protein
MSRAGLNECLRHRQHIVPDTWVHFLLFFEGVMPWKEYSVMDERRQFVARRVAGEPMAELCSGFRHLPPDRAQDLRLPPGMRDSALTGANAPIATPTNFLCSSRTTS